MAIQSTQVPMYTKHTLFLYFSDFSIFFNNFYMKNKINNTKKKKQQKHVKQNNKTRLTQKLESKTNK